MPPRSRAAPGERSTAAEASPPTGAPVGLQQEYLVNVCEDRLEAVHLRKGEKETPVMPLAVFLILLYSHVMWSRRKDCPDESPVASPG